MAEFEVERVGGELKRFGVEGAEESFPPMSLPVPSPRPLSHLCGA